MKYVVRIVLVIAVIGLAYSLYESINKPIRFDKEKNRKYDMTIERMKDIRSSQIAFRDLNQRYSGDFNELIPFLDTADFILTQRRDTVIKFYNKVYREYQLKDSTLVDTLGYRSIKDSLFDKGYNLKQLAFIPETKSKFKIEASTTEKSGLTVQVFQAIAEKEVILKGMDSDLIKTRSKDLIMGSLTEPNLNGNWQ